MENKYGLTRKIPAEVKRKVRQRDGFGCVLCGSGIYEYEHVIPEFSEAKIHDFECITLLCPSCHAKVSRKHLSKESVKEAMKKPFCKQQGYTNECFDIGKGYPNIILSGSQFKGCKIPIMLHNEPVIEFDESEEFPNLFLLSANFYDKNGKESLILKKNEWFANSDLWDIEIIGPTLTIREGPKNISLKLKVSAPHFITIEKIDMYFKDMHLLGDKDTLKLIYRNGFTLHLTGGNMNGGNVGISM